MAYELRDFNQQAGKSTAEFLRDGDAQDQQIVHILCTKKKTRLGRPDFGCYIEKYLFDPVDSTSAFDIKTEIRMALKDGYNELSGVQVQSIEVVPDPENQCHWVNIVYQNTFTGIDRSLSFNLNRITQ